MTTYDQSSQNVGNQFNVGRDQIIHNLVLVGQFLDFAEVEGLIPRSATPADFTTISEAFDSTFEKRLGGDLTQAAASAGYFLSEVMLKFVPKQHPAALPAKKILAEAPHLLYKKLVESDFWNTFYTVCPNLTEHRWIYGGEGEVVWLYSLQILWKKYFKKNELFGISIFRNLPPRILEDYEEIPTNAFLCIIPAEWQKGGKGDVLKESINTKLYAMEVNVDNISYEQFRIIVAGLVIDLIRMCSIASDDIQFWNRLISLMNIKSS
jgi:hypothetical protein